MLNGKFNVFIIGLYFIELGVLKVVCFVVFLVIIFVSLIGNLLVLKIVLEFFRRYKLFMYYLVVNLVVVEIISLICFLFIMVYYEMYSWNFG